MIALIVLLPFVGIDFYSKYTAHEGAKKCSTCEAGRAAVVGNASLGAIACRTCLVGTIAGSGEKKSKDGIGLAVSFNMPSRLALSADGKLLFITDSGDNKVR